MENIMYFLFNLYQYNYLSYIIIYVYLLKDKFQNVYIIFWVYSSA